MAFLFTGRRRRRSAAVVASSCSPTPESARCHGTADAEGRGGGVMVTNRDAQIHHHHHAPHDSDSDDDDADRVKETGRLLLHHHPCVVNDDCDEDAVVVIHAPTAPHDLPGAAMVTVASHASLDSILTSTASVTSVTSTTMTTAARDLDNTTRHDDDDRAAESWSPIHARQSARSAVPPPSPPRSFPFASPLLRAPTTPTISLGSGTFCDVAGQVRTFSPRTTGTTRHPPVGSAASLPRASLPLTSSSTPPPAFGRADAFYLRVSDLSLRVPVSSDLTPHFQVPSSDPPHTTLSHPTARPGPLLPPELWIAVDNGHDLPPSTAIDEISITTTTSPLRRSPAPLLPAAIDALVQYGYDLAVQIQSPVCHWTPANAVTTQVVKHAAVAPGRALHHWQELTWKQPSSASSSSSLRLLAPSPSSLVSLDSPPGGRRALLLPPTTAVSSTADHDAILLWSGSFAAQHHGPAGSPTSLLYGQELPLIRAAGIIHQSAEQLLALLADSTRVTEYNKLSLGRDDLVVFDTALDRRNDNLKYNHDRNVNDTRSDQENDVGRQNNPSDKGNDVDTNGIVKTDHHRQTPIVASTRTGSAPSPTNATTLTKIMRSSTRPPLIRKTLQFHSLLHVRPLEDGTGYLMITRAVTPPRPSDAHSHQPNAATVLHSEILLGVTLLLRVATPRTGRAGPVVSDAAPSYSSQQCLLVALNHIRSPMVPTMIAKRIGLQAAVNFFHDLRALPRTNDDGTDE